MRLIKRVLIVGCIALTAALGVTGCANNGKIFDKTDINNIATFVDGNKTDIKSELSGNEIANNVLIINDAQIKNKPEANGAVIGDITAGQAITVLDKKEYSGYIKVTFNGRVGYILKNCCKLEEDNEPEQPGQPQTSAPVVVPITPTVPAIIPTIQIKPTQAPTEPPTEAPTETMPQQPSTEAPGDEQPSKEQPSDEQPGGEQPSDEQPGGEQPSDEQPGGEQPSDEQPSGEQPSDEQPGDEQPSDEQPTSGSPDNEPEDENDQISEEDE